MQSSEAKGTVTQALVAERAKVSRSTVAAVLCELPTARISPEVRQRVLDTAKEMGYSPNRYAQTLRKGRTGAIGIINFGTGLQTIAQRLSHTVRAISAEGFEAVVHDIFWFADRGSMACSRMLDARVEGIVLLGPNLWFTQRHLDRLLEAGVPVVALGGNHLRGIPCFLSDKKAAFENLTRHVLELGHRRLTLLLGKDSSQKRNARNWHAHQAATGFRETLSKHGGAHGDIHTLSYPLNPHANEELGYEQGALGMAEILRRSLPPDAVLCTNDNWALGAMRACMEADVRTPEDVAITGCENEPSGAAGLLPLTTVAAPVEELSHRAVETLLTAVRSGRRPEAKLTSLSGELIVRHSCGARLKSRQSGFLLLKDPQPQNT